MQGGAIDKAAAAAALEAAKAASSMHAKKKKNGAAAAPTSRWRRTSAWVPRAVQVIQAIGEVDVKVDGGPGPVLDGAYAAHNARLLAQAGARR